MKAALLAAMVALAACEGDDGAQGQPGAPGASGADGQDGTDGQDGSDGQDGADGGTSLTRQVDLAVGNAMCPAGGVRIDSGIDADNDGTLDDDEVEESSNVCAPVADKRFNRVASFLICSQIEPTCNDDTETVAEIVSVSDDGLTLIYTDSEQDSIGFVDFTDPTAPVGAGNVDVGGEPTSVAVRGDYAVVGVNTSADFVNVAGSLVVVDIESQTVVRTIDVGGQPDSVDVSDDDAYVAVVIENERDEDLGDGAPPQLPAGNLTIVDAVGEPAAWGVRVVDLTGIADLYPDDPEPEYVDINSANVAVVTLQENNHIVLVDLPTGTVIAEFSAGTVDLTQIDGTEEDPAQILLTETQNDVPREPDGVTWINDQLFATADEGDLDGGSRGFTVFNQAGTVVFTSGSSNDHAAVRMGHYPDGRSGNKGNEPENAAFGTYDGEDYLFVNSERSSLVFVYNVADPANPVYVQTLPTGVGPEGALAIPSRNLLVVASEVDDRGDKIRSVLNIYRYDKATAQYPTLVSADGPDGTPISWSAMSGLAADHMVDYMLYAVEDSFYGKNRIFHIDTSTTPARLIDAMQITDANGVFAAIPAVALADPSVATDDATRIDVFDEADLAALINDDNTVNIDPEGIAHASGGGFWVASEGNGTAGDAGRPINSRNFIFKTSSSGVIESVVTLPDDVNAGQLRFGFEGITEWDGKAYVAFQRVWSALGDTNARIGIYDVASASWSFLFYPLDAPVSQNGGWVGLSDITALGGGEFLVVERDNQGGPDAAIKRLYRFDVSGLSDGATITKTLVRDLMADLAAPGGLVAEKVEGSAVAINGDVWIVNDNDGVDDNSGETQLLNLGDIL